MILFSLWLPKKPEAHRVGDQTFGTTQVIIFSITQFLTCFDIYQVPSRYWTRNIIWKTAHVALSSKNTGIPIPPFNCKHLCVRTSNINSSRPRDAYMLPWNKQYLVQISRTTASLLLIEHLGINFNEVLIKHLTFQMEEIHWKMSSRNWWPFCLGFNVLNATSLCYVLFIENQLQHNLKRAITVKVNQCLCCKLHS